jgi:hypothetical protein
MRPDGSAEPQSIPEPAAALDFIGIDGQPRRWQVRYGQPVGHPVQVREVSAEHGESAVLRMVPAALVRTHLAAGDGLENEVRAGLRVAARFSGLYPTELRRLIGYNLERAAPFVLVEGWRGQPVADLAGRLDLSEQLAFELSLFRGLQLLAEAGVVHGGLSATTVYWDGTDVHIGHFDRSAIVGDARVAQPDLGWAAPEQRNGTGLVTLRDDTWAAGLLVLQVVTGRVPTAAELSGRGAALQNLLAGVFSPAAEDRPSAAEMLQRLGEAAAEPVPLPTPAAFIAGAAAFDRVLADKQPAGRPAAPTEPPPADPPRRRRRFLVVWPLWVMVAVGMAATRAVLMARGLA